MSDPIPTASEQRLQEYLARLTTVLGHADRQQRLVGYCTGLLLPGERKSVEPPRPSTTAAAAQTD
jgi:SRSO17 transposase